jgi:hypothetical protein
MVQFTKKVRFSSIAPKGSSSIPNFGNVQLQLPDFNFSSKQVRQNLRPSFLDFHQNANIAI